MESIIVKADVADVYDIWSDVRNYPKFMADIQFVDDLGGHKSYWSSQEGPNGVVLAWEVKFTHLEENRRLAWRSTGGDVKSSGQVTFTPLAHGETEVTVVLHHAPPVDLSEDVHRALFSELDKRLLRDLRNFKAYVEDMPERIVLEDTGSRETSATTT
jgi:uncharacterized membrane protein